MMGMGDDNGQTWNLALIRQSKLELKGLFTTKLNLDFDLKTRMIASIKANPT